jgi:hypothetical protein
VSKRTDSPGLGSLASAALTAASTLLVASFAAVVGILIAREFGRTDETDGFFAAYGVFFVVVLAAQAIRIAVLPALARSRQERRLAGEITGFAVAIAVVAVPLLLVAELAADPFASLLTGGESDVAQRAAVDALRWMAPAAVAHLFAGLAASGLAALDDYVTAAVGYAAGSAAGLALMLLRVEPDGIVAVAWGMMVNGVVSLLVPLAVLAWRAQAERMPRGAVRPTGAPLTSRLGVFATAASLPIALQLLYVVCLPFAGARGSGSVTSFGYAYLAAASLVSVTAVSLGLVTSVPLARSGLSSELAARHVVASSWIALAFVGAAAGVFALAGADVVEAVLGDAYGGDVGAEVGQLVVVLSPWMVVSVGVNVAFPLAFVVERLRALPWIGALALAAQVILAWIGVELAGLDGLALALAISTSIVLVALLRQLDAVRPAVLGLALAAVAVAALTLAAFLPPALVLGSSAATLVGLVVYVLLVGVTRPQGLRDSWAYLRELG